MKPATWIGLVLAILAGNELRGAESAIPDRPNVLFLFADDQRADTIAALGNGIIKTPNLDRLVKRGVSFDRAYMQGGMQGATCVPSRAMLLSGRSVFRVDEKLMRDPTWPASFGKSGYTTFVSGKWHNGPESIPKSFQVARSIFAGGMTDPMHAYLSDMIDGKLTPPKLSPKHACEAFADEAIRFLGEQKKGPFFCYIPFDAPHDPHIVPPDFPIQYAPNTMPLPRNFMPVHPWNNGEMSNRDEQLLPWPRTAEKVREMNADYYRYVSYLDSQIGRVLDSLDASPHAKNTIVVFAADSGVSRGSHGLIGKQNVYEESMRVPLIIAGPGIPEGKRTNAMIYLFDVMPTLGALCDVPAPSTSEGIPFTASLLDPSKPARSEMMFAYRNVQRAVRDDRWKLIRYPLVNKTQLFDLKNDPDETRNLADLPESAEKIASMMTMLESLQTQFGDKSPLKVANPQPAEWVPPRVSFRLDGHTAFVIMPMQVDAKRPIPWVWYAPTFSNLPEPREDWMFAQFLKAGIAITGVDVGESYGSPDGRAIYSSLYSELVKNRNFAPRPVLLARSRGGLMLYNWACENAEKVGGIAGIYPVCDLRSYPGLDKASGAYGMTTKELESKLEAHNPVSRLAPLARAKVPIFHIHGDVDATVPLKENSGEVDRQYTALGGTMELKIAKGQGHNVWSGFFQCQELVDFVLKHAAQVNTKQ